MPAAPDYYSEGPEALVASLAARGDKQAYAALVQRKQSWVRNLMRRCCGNNALADDLSQQVFLQVWRKIRQLKEPEKFSGWIKQLAINVWLQHQRRNDPLRDAGDTLETQRSRQDSVSIGMDLDKALATLPDPVRLCVVLSYYAQMTHHEIAKQTDIQLGTVKSHIRRGSIQLRELLTAYGEQI